METAGELGDRARDLLAWIEGGKIEAVTSEITLAELLRGAGPPTSELYQAYLQLFEDRASLEVVTVTRSILVEAATLELSGKTALVDRVHLATARQWGCEAVLTEDADMRLPADMSKLTLAQITELK